MGFHPNWGETDLSEAKPQSLFFARPKKSNQKKRRRKWQLQGVLVAQSQPELGPNTLQFAPFPESRPRGKCEWVVLSVMAFSVYWFYG